MYIFGNPIFKCIIRVQLIITCILLFSYCGHATSLPTRKIPKEVRASFKMAYPKIALTQWSYVGGFYYANVVYGNMREESCFSPNGEWLYTRQIIPEHKLPMSAHNFIEKHYSAYIVHKCTYELNNFGKPIFYVDLYLNSNKTFALCLVFDLAGLLLQIDDILILDTSNFVSYKLDIILCDNTKAWLLGDKSMELKAGEETILLQKKSGTVKTHTDKSTKSKKKKTANVSLRKETTSKYKADIPEGVFLPENVVLNFTKKYPNAKNPVWKDKDERYICEFSNYDKEIEAAFFEDGVQVYTAHFFSKKNIPYSVENHIKKADIKYKFERGKRIIYESKYKRLFAYKKRPKDFYEVEVSQKIKKVKERQYSILVFDRSIRFDYETPYDPANY